MPFFGLFGPPNVEKLKAKGDVQGLIKVLGYEKDAAVRLAAARALGAIGDSRALEPLLVALKDKDKYVRQAAAEALGKLKDRRAVEPLAAALKDRETLVRVAVASALGKIRDERVVASLMAALEDSVGIVRKSVAEALDNLGWQPSDDTQRVALAVARRQWDQLVTLGTAAVKPLITVLKDENEYGREERGEAATALGKIGDGRAIEPLMAALHHRHIEVRDSAAEALKQIGLAAIEPMILSFNVLEFDKLSSVELVLRTLIADHATELSSEQLQTIIQLKNPQGESTHVEPCFGEAPYWHTPEVDVSGLKQLARQELIRRGEEA